MANNPSNLTGLAQFLLSIRRLGRLSPAQLAWWLFVALNGLNFIVTQLPAEWQINFYRFAFAPILALAFYAAKYPYPPDVRPLPPAPGQSDAQTTPPQG